MKNFKNLAFGLVIGALALGFSAFTNAEPSALATVYYHLGGGNYGLTPPEDSECTADPRSCTISFANDPSGAYPTFNISELSSVEAVGGTAAQSSAKGFWQ